MTDIGPMKAGKVYVFSSGEYSDYCIRGHFIALRDITEEELKDIATDAWRKAEEAKPDEPPLAPGERPWHRSYYNVYDAAERLLLPALIRLGALVDIDVDEIHLFEFTELADKA